MLDFLLTHSPLFYLTQSLWRDEAFSILTAEKPVMFLLGGVGIEPPFYYLLLHFWMKIFGESEIAARGLSFIAFLFATFLVGIWAEKTFKKHFLSWFLPLFFFLNPMLLYYAFEVRTYGWFIFFATAALITYLEKKWIWYFVSCVLGFYTHVYFIFVPFVQLLHWLITNKFQIQNSKFKIQTILSDPFLRALTASGLLMIPWLVKIILELTKFKDAWYFPVDWHLIKSVLGNMFLGYEGTPWFLWSLTGLLSLVLLGMFIWSLKPSKTRKRNFLFLLLVFVPLIIIIGISFQKPLFVNRYLIPVTIAEVFLICFFIESLKSRFWQYTFLILNFTFLIFFNAWYPTQHAKLDIRTPLAQINTLKSKQDLIYVTNPLVFFEVVYYSRNRTQVFWYNPQNATFPWYIGDIIFTPNQISTELPTYPVRAFLINERGNFEIVYRTPTIKL